MPYPTTQSATIPVARKAAARDAVAIAVLDLGGQYCHMISRRLRDLGISSEIIAHDVPANRLQRYRGIVLSGGPQSVYQGGPKVDPRIRDIGVPVLGICYGHQLLAQMLGCKVTQGAGEYGKAELHVNSAKSLFADTSPTQTVWMSHGDSVREVPEDIEAIANTASCAVAAFAHKTKPLFGVQFHPEVIHTSCGQQLLANFGRSICGIQSRETIEDLTENLMEEIRQRAGEKSVLFFVSGGVDSTVAFALCARALPRDRVLGVYVDTGLMRKNETEELQSLLGALGLSDRLKVRRESGRFLPALERVFDPEDKRKIIGRLFIDVQNDAMKEYGIDAERWMLGQGTIYPDTVESGGASITTALIKTHHNRCAEVRELIAQGRVIEPLAQFYKDEVRRIGDQLGLDRRLTGRWPFPGPGLAIRCLCSQSDNKVEPFELPRGFEEYKAVRFPLDTVGVQGDARTYSNATAVVGPLDYDKLQLLSSTVCNTSRTINRVTALVAGDASKLMQATVRAKTLSSKRLELLREADHAMRLVMEKNDLTASVWQFPVIMIPVSLEAGEIIVLRPVKSEDGMTADFAHLPHDVLRQIGDAIMQINGVDAVVLDVTNKPPATIEWE